MEFNFLIENDSKQYCFNLLSNKGLDEVLDYVNLIEDLEEKLRVQTGMLLAIKTLKKIGGNDE